MAYCSSCGCQIPEQARLCRQCDTRLFQHGGRKPPGRKLGMKVPERAWAIVLVGGILFLVVLMTFITNQNNPANHIDSSKRSESDDDFRERYVTKDSIAGTSIEDMAFASRAWRGKDYDGIAALLGSGRIFEISKGTKVRAG